MSYIGHLKPRYFIPNHHDRRRGGRFVIGMEGWILLDALRAANVPEAPWLHSGGLMDPNDYLRPLVFDLK